ncbi:MAG: DUF3987 domain-containing protein [Christensenellaceae bacterium]|jgi:hypothetical protein
MLSKCKDPSELYKSNPEGFKLAIQGYIERASLYEKAKPVIIEPTPQQGDSLPPVPQPPKIDPVAFYGLAGNFVKLVEPETESDPVALLIQFLTFYGNAIGRTAFWEVGKTSHFCNLFAVLVGQSSRGRKGTSLDIVKSLFRSIDEAWTDNCIKSGLSSGEGIKYAIRDALTKQEPIKDGKELVGYKEVIIDPGIEDKRLLVIEPEFANVLKLCDRDGNTLSSVLRQLWDDGDLRNLTKNDPIRATGGHGSIIGHITKDELLRYLNSTEAANGFANRFLWLWVQRSKLLPRGGNLNKLNFQPIIQRLTEVARFARLLDHPMEFDEEAFQAWDKIYPYLTREIPGLLGSITARGEAQVKRLSCIYALLDADHEIRIQHLKAALALWEYAEASSEHIFGEALGDSTADTILEALRNSPGGMSRTDISKLFNRHKTAAQIQQALSLLQRNELAQPQTFTTDGRAKEVWIRKNGKVS